MPSSSRRWRARRASGWASSRSSSRARSARCCSCSGSPRCSRRAGGGRASRPPRPSPSRRSSRSSRSPPSTQRAREDFTVVRGGSASLLFRTFVADRIVEPDNGEASAELARAVSRELLPYEPYRSRGIDVEAFFSSGSSRMHDDLTVLSDRTWGWDDDYRHLGRVAREAIRAHPGPYARGVAKDLWRLLLWPLYGPVEASASSAPSESGSESQAAAPAPAVPPADDEPIPSSREAPYISTPGGRIREVWTSPTEHSIVFRDPADAARSAALDREVERAARRPARSWRPPVPRGPSQRRLAPLPASVHVARSSRSSQCSGADRGGSRSRRCSPPRAGGDGVDVARRVRGRGVLGPGRPRLRAAGNSRSLRSPPTREGPCRRRLRSPVGDAGPAPRPEDRARSSAAPPTSTRTRSWRSLPMRAG